MDDPVHNTNGGTADHTSVPLSQTNSQVYGISCLHIYQINILAVSHEPYNLVQGGMEQLPVQNTNGDTANRFVPLNQTNAKVRDIP